ncbi:hypothetical protein [Eleftheria terrae]|uniref:hypothetical protein n=1 Tax=Eleftheria terrae TaxID=1597781 RepID=UPI00263B8B41|nr:hypothetical protein [Eleftheria terrae]WKB51799.1 hypothetical protein N7L95_18625 [Eleftheria terrae]
MKTTLLLRTGAALLSCATWLAPAVSEPLLYQAWQLPYPSSWSSVLGEAGELAVSGIESPNAYVLLPGGGVRALPSLGLSPRGYGESTVKALQPNGDAVGASTYFERGIYRGHRATLWRQGQPVHLGSLGTDAKGNGRSSAELLNAAGMVAGNSLPFDATGTRVAYSGSFLWHQGRMVQLAPLATGLPYRLDTTVHALNAHGWTAGTAGWHDGQRHTSRAVM